jgi:NADPH-dependent 2,4-dienoyl-CoA reductase/sulfur reductase-like enzyme
MERIICIGSSAASLSCAAQIQRLNPDALVTILTAQTEKPNNICLLADYAAERRLKESLYLRVPDAIDIKYNTHVIEINVAEKKVITKMGHEYQYDKLFIGTGLQARIPEAFIPDLYTKIFPFKSLDDLVRFEKIESGFIGKELLIIGGGVTGIEASEAFTMRGYKVTLLEKNAHLLPTFNNPEISQQVYELLVKNGVTVLLGADAFKIVPEWNGPVFLAMGGTPVTDFLKNQLELENGFIKVNEFQQTCQPDIFAGGDVCIGRSLWPQAVKDGVIAAYAIMGQAVPEFNKRQYKTVITLFGVTTVL